MTPRDRSTARVKRWIRAGVIAALAVAVPAALFEASVGLGTALPVWTPAAVPMVYLLLAPAFLRRVSPGRRIVWALLAWAAQIALGLATAMVLAGVRDLGFDGAWQRVLWRFAPATILHFIAAPFVLLPFRERLLPRGSSRGSHVPAHARTAGTPTPVFSPRPAAGATTETPFARQARQRDTGLSPAAEAPPAPATPSGHVQARAAAMPSGDDGDVLRIPFQRIAAQIPVDMFVLPAERLAASLREPGVLVVPRHLVVPQLRDGAVEIAWTVIEDQFPELAFAVSPYEIRAKYPEWKLSLPLEEIVRQMPSEMFRAPAPVLEAPGIEAFPPPFQPFSSAAPAAVVSPAVVAPVTASVPSPPATIEMPPMPSPVVLPPVTPAVEAPPPALAVPLPAAAPEPPSTPAPPPAEPVIVATAPEPPREPIGVAAADEPPPAAPIDVEPPEPDHVAAGVLDVSDPEPFPPAGLEDAEVIAATEWAREIARGFTAMGPLEVGARRAEDEVVASLTEAGIDAGAVAVAAARLLPFLEATGAMPCDQVTLRTSRAVVVVTRASTAALAVALRPGGPIALAEIVVQRAAREDGAPSAARARAARRAPRTLAPAAIGQHAGTVGNALDGFGRVAPALFADDRELSIYVFRPRELPAQPLGDVASALWEALTGDGALGMLGAIEAIVLRHGRRRSVVRRLAPAAGRPALLVASGAVDHAGLAHRQIARAAAQLEAV